MEIAKSTFLGAPNEGASHLSAALQALNEISPGRSETSMTYEDWTHVSDICAYLDPVVTVLGSRDALRDLDHIRYQAIQWRDR